MIGVGTLLFALLLMSDGMTVRKELSGECNCGDEDSSEVSEITNYNMRFYN